MVFRVTRSKKDRDGDIIGLCGNGWSHTKARVVANMRTASHRYYVLVGGREVDVRVGSRNGSPYLTTSPDGFSPNNLDDLPTC